MNRLIRLVRVSIPASRALGGLLAALIFVAVGCGVKEDKKAGSVRPAVTTATAGAQQSGPTNIMAPAVPLPQASAIPTAPTLPGAPSVPATQPVPTGTVPAGVLTTGSFGVTGYLGTARIGHTATKLANGNVVILAGVDATGGPTASVEVFSGGVWQAGGHLQTARANHSAILLPNGRIWVAGGEGVNGTLATTEFYDPVAGNSVTGPVLVTARAAHAAVRYQDNGQEKVLLAGGFRTSGSTLGSLRSSEIFDVSTGQLQAGPDLSEDRAGAQAFLVGGQWILIVGGARMVGQAASPAQNEIFDIATNLFALAPGASVPRIDAAVAAMGADDVLVAGGRSSSDVESSADTFGLLQGGFAGTGVLHHARTGATATLLADGRVLILGGVDNNGTVDLAEAYQGGGFTSLPNPMVIGRTGHTATLLNSDSVLVVGGVDAGGQWVSLVEEFDPNGMSATPAAPATGGATNLNPANPGTSSGGTAPPGATGNTSTGSSGLSAQGPMVVAVVPAVASPGDTVWVYGMRFGAMPPDNQVSINGQATVVRNSSPTQLEVEVPPGAASGDLLVLVAGLASPGYPVTIVPAPSGATNPPTGAGSSSGSTPGTVPTTPTNPTTPGATLPVPPSLPGGGPVVSQILPPVGREGQPVVIQGKGFSVGPAEVKFGNLPGDNTKVISDTTIATFVPQGANTGSVHVEVAGQASNSVRFFVVSFLNVQVKDVKVPAIVEVGKKIDVEWTVKYALVVIDSHIEWGTASGNYTDKTSAKRGTSGTYIESFAAPAQPGEVYLIVDTWADNQKLQSKEYVVQVVPAGSGATAPTAPGASSPGAATPAAPASIEFAPNLPAQVAPGDTVQIEWEIKISGGNTVDLTNIAWGEQSGNLPNLTVAQAGLAGFYGDVVTVPATATGFVVKGRAVVMGGYLVETPEVVIPVISGGVPNSSSPTTPSSPGTSQPSAPAIPGTQIPATASAIDIVSVPAAVSVGDLFSVEWEVLGAQQVTDSLIRWGAQSGQYSDSSAAQSGTSQLFSHVVAAPGQAGSLFLMAECVADGQLIRSSEVSVSVDSTSQPQPPTGTTAGGTSTAPNSGATNSTGTTAGGTQASTPAGPVSKIQLKSLKAPAEGYAGQKVTIRWAFDNVQGLTANVVEWGTSSGLYTQNTGNAGKQYWLFGDYQEDVTLPAKEGAVYFRITAVDSNGLYTSAERVIQVKALPVATITALPVAGTPGESVAVKWTVTKGAQVSKTFLRWGTRSGSYTSSGKTFSGAAGEFSMNAVLSTAVGDRYVVAEAVVDGQTVRSAEKKISFAYDLQIMSISYPSAVKSGDNVAIKWGIKHVKSLEHANVHWGTTSGDYPYFGDVLSSVSFWGTYENKIVAPLNGKIYFVVHVKGDGREKYSTEYSIPVQGRPVVQVTCPKTVDALRSFDVSWTVSNVAQVTNTQAYWHKKGLIGSTIGALFPEKTPLQNGAGGTTFRASITAPLDGKIILYVEGYGDGQKFKSQDFEIVIQDKFQLSVNYPKSVDAGKSFEVTWTLSNVQKVTETYVEYDYGLLSFAKATLKQTGTSGTYKATVPAPNSGSVEIQIIGNRDGQSFKSAKYRVTVNRTVVIDVYSYPTTVAANAKYSIKWKIGNTQDMTHANVHWGTATNALTRFGTVYTSTSFWGTYENELTAPASGTVFWNVHVKDAGQDFYSQERTISVH